MNFNPLPPGLEPETSLQMEWQRQIEAWRDLLAQCIRRPSRKRVHALRALTLRLGLVLEHCQQEQTPARSAVRAFRRWNKQGKKLRRALEPVRDTDVYLARLEGLRDSIQKTRGGKSRLSRLCLRQIDALECLLERQREDAGHELIATLRVRDKRLIRLSREMEETLSPQLASRKPSTARAALEIFIRVSEELPSLDSSNLHTYRKHLKQALYLAEVSAAVDPLAKRLATTFRRIHVTIGEWHDWQALALEAGRNLTDRGKRDGLVPFLETLAGNALQRALALCRRAATQILKC